MTLNIIKLARTKILAGITTVFLCVWIVESTAAIEFEDASTAAGVTNSSRSYSACWGDINNDGWLDLYASNHADEHTLYQNMGDGTFLEVQDIVMPWIKRDAHGCYFADFDRDGDQDMILLSGGNGGREIIANNFNQLYINDGGVFTEQAEEAGLLLGEYRARTPLWFDFDKDGLLDLLTTNFLHPDGFGRSTILRQTTAGGPFEDISQQLGFDTERTIGFAQLSDLSGDGNPDLVLWERPGGSRVLDITTLPFRDITSEIPGSNFTGGKDTTVADFDGDLRPDIYVALHQVSDGEVYQPNDRQLRMSFGSDAGSSSTLRFRTAGNVDVQLQVPFLNMRGVYIGAARMNITDWNFTLTRDIGLPSFNSGVDHGVFLGFDNQTGEWVFTISKATHTQGAGIGLNAIVDSANSITVSGITGFNPDPTFKTDSVRINSANGLINRSGGWLPGPDTPSVGVVSGDFDNDMDVDVYVINSLVSANYPNTLYENVGGRFQVVPNAGGAEGSTDGAGDNAVVADYDNDGFLDLYVMNGRGSPLFGDAAHQLFRNKGNTNHWMKLDLVGTASNPHGIGARILLTANGVTQLREQNGGLHMYQSHSNRVHFGLGTATQADTIRIEWPSGTVQELRNVSADQLLTVVEDGSAPPPVGGTASLGDFVWEDTDGDGIQDAGEPGLGGVTVELKACNGNVLQTTVSGGDGRYAFSNLAAGCYKLGVIAPSGYGFSPLRQGSNHTKDSDVDPNTGVYPWNIVLEDGYNWMGFDAGLVPESTGTASLGDRVWVDSDGDGVQDTGESGLAGVTVQLRQCNGAVLATQVTDSSGAYRFNNLAAGCYKIAVIAPSGYVFSPLKRGGDHTKDSDVQPSTGVYPWNIVLQDGFNWTGFDAGLVPTGGGTGGTASLGDRVWVDTDGDGIQDAGEPGLGGVMVQLKNCSGDVLDVRTTGSSGAYQFNNLAAGCYKLAVIAPSGYRFSPLRQGNDHTRDSDVGPNTGIYPWNIVLGAGFNWRGFDAGLVPDGSGAGATASIGDFTWADVNSNGIQDPGELGLGGVTVQLKDCNGNLLDTQVTDSDGLYMFSNLVAGGYKIGVIAPSGYGFSPRRQGTMAWKDSDVVPGTGVTWCVNLTEGKSSKGVDAGLFQL